MMGHYVTASGNSFVRFLWLDPPPFFPLSSFWLFPNHQKPVGVYLLLYLILWCVLIFKSLFPLWNIIIPIRDGLWIYLSWKCVTWGYIPYIDIPIIWYIVTWTWYLCASIGVIFSHSNNLSGPYTFSYSWNWWASTHGTYIIHHCLLALLVNSKTMLDKGGYTFDLNWYLSFN